MQTRIIILTSIPLVRNPILTRTACTSKNVTLSRIEYGLDSEDMTRLMAADYITSLSQIDDSISILNDITTMCVNRISFKTVQART